MTADDPRFALPDLNVEQLAELMSLTAWQVEERCRKGVFICHWRGNSRGRRFTPEDVAYNRSINLGQPRASQNTITPKMRKGAAKLRELNARAAEHAA